MLKDVNLGVLALGKTEVIKHTRPVSPLIKYKLWIECTEQLSEESESKWQKARWGRHQALKYHQNCSKFPIFPPQILSGLDWKPAWNTKPDMHRKNYKALFCGPRTIKGDSKGSEGRGWGSSFLKNFILCYSRQSCISTGGDWVDAYLSEEYESFLTRGAMASRVEAKSYCSLFSLCPLPLSPGYRGSCGKCMAHWAN